MGGSKLGSKLTQRTHSAPIPQCLLLDHPRRHIRDTAHYKPFRVHAKGRTPSLKKLAKEVLQKDIQDGSHCPAEDARTALLLYKMHKQEWDAELKKKTFLRAAGGKKK